jgi:phosphatidylethanolamine-binding protein (PEBP) family uncharacterized protein
MLTGIKIQVCLLILGCIFCTNCKKENQDQHFSDVFSFTSPVVDNDNLLPAKYTCDGAGISPPVEWSGFPAVTSNFALIMHHEASPTDIHWYWVLYNIPADVYNLVENSTGTGTFGNNSVNNHLAYAPPCSQGPGVKEYVLTIYALSDSVIITNSPDEVSRDVLLDAIKNITLASASLTVKYSRP